MMEKECTFCGRLHDRPTCPGCGAPRAGVYWHTWDDPQPSYQREYGPTRFRGPYFAPSYYSDWGSGG